METKHYMNDSAMIDKIRQYGKDIFTDESLESSLVFDISESDQSFDQNRYQQQKQNQYISLKSHLTPTKTTRQKNRNKKTYNSNQSFDSKLFSNYSKKFYKDKQITQRTTERSPKNTTSRIRNYSSQKKASIPKTIRRKIFDVYQQEEKINRQKEQSKKKNDKSAKKYEHVKSRYREEEPLLKNISGFIEKNVYGRYKTETDYLHRKPKLSREESQKKWQRFIANEKKWMEKKVNFQLKAKVRQQNQHAQIIAQKPKRKSPPKSSIEQNLRRLRNKTQKLKERLNQYTFEPKLIEPRLYEIERNKYKLSKSRSQDKKKESLSKSGRQQLTAYKRMTIINNPAQNMQFVLGDL